jgi:alpha-D-xyloside xylohydrolase
MLNRLGTGTIWFGITMALLANRGLGQTAPATSAPANIERQSDGIILPQKDGDLKIQVLGDNLIRVAFAKDRAFFDRPSLVVLLDKPAAVQWNVDSTGDAVTLSTAKLKVQINRETGAVSFLDSAGKPILAEKSEGRMITPAIIQGSQTNHIRQRWEPNDDESLYGLGENQLGLVNIKGYDIDLWQHNGTVVVPMLVSSKGYGILWDNDSFSRFGDLRQADAIPTSDLYDADGKPGGLTASYFGDGHFQHLVAKRTETNVDVPPPPQNEPPGPWQGQGQWQGQSHITNTRIHPDLPPRGDISVRWEGFVEPKQTGEHIFETYSNAGIKVWIDDKLVIDHWRQGWLPWYDVAKVSLNANQKYKLRVEWSKDQGDQIRLAWKTPVNDHSTSLWSEVGDGIDYYFCYGPRLDDVIAGYRDITGPAPMMPIWTLGLWQSRQRYETAKQALDVVDGFRSRKIPFDNIVEDWFYWKEAEWGSHQFDPARFPDPVGWVQAIHDRNARVMISVWPKFYPGTANFEEMRAHGYLYERVLADETRDWVGHPYTFYDAFNPEAGKLFWKQIEKELFVKKFDAWWLDATEPDLTKSPTLQGQRQAMHPTALGPASKVLNAFALVNAHAVYEGQRAAAPDERVFILTRSGFAGQQRYAAATWSGDTSSSWQAMHKQIAAGIGFCLSGVPWWSMDSGGFSVPPQFSSRTPKEADVEEWRELNTRWFEFATFVPLLRVHGEFPYREMWEFGGDDSPAYKAQLKFDRLRYRLLPYIYSLAGEITHDGGTMMRGLVMDFPQDATARDITDQYLFGPAFLVSPITTYKAQGRKVYLPKDATWYDFWTGQSFTGGQSIDSPAAYDSMPVHVRAGSIIPIGPELQYTTEKSADPITLYIYTGADGAFTLYEDDGLTNAYEKGAFTQIPIKWKDAAKTLTIGKRQGSFPGMLASRNFEIVLVGKDKPVGFSFTPKSDRSVKYSGDSIDVKLN